MKKCEQFKPGVAMNKVFAALLDDTIEELRLIDPDSAQASRDLKTFLRADGDLAIETERFVAICLWMAQCVAVDPGLRQAFQATMHLRAQIELSGLGVLEVAHLVPETKGQH